MDMIEGVRAAIKEMMLPELDRIREESKEIKATLVMMNKRLDDVNLHLADQSRRIDETNKRIDETNKRIDSVRNELVNRIDETNKRIDETNKRIDSLQSDFITQMNALASRLDRLYEVIVRRDEHQLAEQRIAILEKDVAEIKYRLAA
jgi:peptidoglycan hydrolase CwlO-like protein